LPSAAPPEGLGIGDGPSEDLLFAVNGWSVEGISCTSALLFSCGSSSSFSGVSSGSGIDESAGRSFHLAVTVENEVVEVRNMYVALRASRDELEVGKGNRRYETEYDRTCSIDLQALHGDDRNASRHGRVCP
jgi:hypothetical protein